MRDADFARRRDPSRTATRSWCGRSPPCRWSCSASAARSRRRARAESRFLAGGPGDSCPAHMSRGCGSASDPRVAAACPAWERGGSTICSRLGCSTGVRLHIGLRPVEREDMVHDLPVPRPHLDRLNPFRFGEVRRDVEVLVLDHAVGRNLVLLLHLEDDVRLADGPAVRVDRRRRQVLRVALRRAGVRPRDQRLLLVRRSARARSGTCLSAPPRATAACAPR